MPKTSNARARVQVTLEIDAGTWGSTCAIQQVYDQAQRTAIEKVDALIAGEQGLRRFGPVKVLAILAEEGTET